MKYSMATENEPIPAISSNVDDETLAKTDEDGTIKENVEQPLYFNKNGKPQFGVTVPSAFALSYPHPPLPSNLGKNRVLRAHDEQSKESLQEGITEAENEFEKEAMPLPGLTRIHGSPIPRVLIPEIELALYWDRHPYEFRHVNRAQEEKEKGTKLDNHTKVQSSSEKQNSSGTSSSLRRSKSEMNLASQIGEILQEDKISRRSSLSSSAAGKSSRGSNVSVVSSGKNTLTQGNEKRVQTPKNNHQRRQSPKPSSDNSVHNHHNTMGNGKYEESVGGRESISEKISIDGSVTKKLNEPMQLSESERRKFEDIKPFNQSNNHYMRNNGQGHNSNSRPKLIRSAEQAQQMEVLGKSTGVQVTLDDVTTAAMKSTYLCPLHGQYRRGIERRDKGGFRTDMSSVANAHAYCSRALKGVPSRTKLIKSAETQTDDELPVETSQEKPRRSKTATVNARNLKSKIKDVMASEYHGSFRDPYKIADSEKRHLRNRILNYCFTKHSIF